MSHTDTESAIKNNRYILFASIPVGIILGFLKFTNIYEFAALVLFIAAICFVYDQLDKIAPNDVKDNGNPLVNILSQIGFIIVIAGALLFEKPYFDWLFLTGILFCTLFAGTMHGLAAVCIYASMITLFSRASGATITLYLLAGVLAVILVKYMDDAGSIPYMLVTELALVIALFIIINNFAIAGLFTADHVVDVLVIILSFIIAFVAGKKFDVLNKKPDESEEDNKETEVKEEADIKDEVESEATFEAKVETEGEGETTPRIETEEAVENESAQEARAVEEANVEIKVAEAIATTEIEAEAEAALKAEPTVETETVIEAVTENPAESEPEIDAEDEITPKVVLLTIEHGKNDSKEPEIDYSALLTEDFALYDCVKENEEVYEKALVRSFLAEGAAERAGLNQALAAAGAFYCECGRIVSKNYIKEGIKLAKQYDLPEKVVSAMKEHNFKVGHPKSKENALIMLIDKLDNTIEYFESTGKKIKPDLLIDEVCDSCLMDGRLDASGLTISEYKLIKDYLIMEVPDTYAYFD